MARILGVNIPDNKRVVISLTYIYGIGKHHSAKILDRVGINQDSKVSLLTPEELTNIAKEINDNYTIEGMLKAEKLNAIKNLKDIGCYRGRRHRIGLPVRGKTKNNCRTHKGPRPNMIKKRRTKQSINKY